MENGISIDPSALRQECLSFGIFVNVCRSLVLEQGGTLDPKVEEGIVLGCALFLYSVAVKPESATVYYSALGYEYRKFEKSDGSFYEYPAWGEEEESLAERLGDAFFGIYALFLASSDEKKRPADDFIAPVLFFSGAIREDLEEGLSKKKGDPHYDAFYTEITSYPFAQIMKESALKFYDLAHAQEA